jgi:acetyl-CoA acetyltransferase
MNDFSGVSIIAVAEVRYRRHAQTATAALLAGALRAVLSEAGALPAEVDGLGVAAFTLPPDHAIDFAWRTGLSPRWCMDDCLGGASGINLLQHAARAIQAGDASLIALVSGEHFTPADFTTLVDNYNRTTQQFLRPLNTGGPNPLFAMLTLRQMQASKLERADYGALCVAQRGWAAQNPDAVYRAPLSLDDYLAAPLVADPLCRFDCVPVVSGANAVLLAASGHPAARRAAAKGLAPVGIRAQRAIYNFDQQAGDGLQTGLHLLRDPLLADAGIDPVAVDVVSLYDDYPAMVLAQLADLGFAPDADLRYLVHERIATRKLAVNTSGGQLSAGQAGAAAGMHGLVEVVRQLQHRAGARQVSGARLATVSGYGMVQYRYGMCANAAILERGP